ncbi:MAG: dynamin family protein [Deltaproteobacteria bacterium]|nr:dynamin family protein [Deltaproteobacteria bacterium]
METYSDIKKKLLSINGDIRLVLQNALSMECPGLSLLEGWKSTTTRIERQLGEETIRIAVVGSIKSGKSTLVNAIFGGDYLKRGAGVVTSVITRIQPGHNLRARLRFKTWNEINAEINQGLILFSSGGRGTVGGNFNIRQKKDRLQLQEEISKLDRKQLITNDARNPNLVLLTNYLKGYNRAKNLVSSEPAIHTFEADDFYKQKEFVGDESLAVYLQDVALSLDAPESFGENLEIADCQGSDSPNPLHLAMIQDYLLETHLIIYVLSSRTGVRQADIKFLTLINEMGLAKNILFVLNCDLTEHEDLADLKKLVIKTEEELDMILPSPRLFAFSALYNLFKSLESTGTAGEALARKDRFRLEQWRQDNDITAFSDEETKRFLDEIVQKTSKDRFALLIETNLDRLFGIVSGMRDWVQINQALLERDSGKRREIFDEIDKRRKTSGQVTMIIKDTMDGTTSKLKQELRRDIERFFDPKYGEAIRGILDFVDSHGLSAKDYEKDLETSGLLPTLYQIFQALQHDVTRYMAESVNPKIVNFIRGEEQKVKDVFDRISESYSLMIKDSFHEHHRSMKKLGIKLPTDKLKGISCPDIAVVKSDAGLKIPRLITAMRYTARIRTEAIFRLGLYNTLKAMKKLLKKPVDAGPDSAIRSTEHTVRRMKEEIQESIIHSLIDYTENLKYQYFFKLVDAVSSRLYEALTSHSRAFTVSLLNVRSLIEDERLTKQELMSNLSSMAETLDLVAKKIGKLEEIVVESRLR